MLACREIRAKTSGRAGFMADHRASGLGFVLSVTGSRAEVRLYAGDATANHDESRVTIGKLIAVRTPKSAVVGVVARLSGPGNASGDYHPSDLSADVDFLGEIVEHGTPEAYFQRGVSEYPAVGDKVMALDTEDISVIHHIAGGETINVGRLKMDAKVPAYINFDELLQKHFAVLGTTGVGKSSAVALILREILKKKANLRIFLIDPHNEYGHCFGDMANVISPKNLKLPFWLFDFEEIVDVFFRARPGVEEETEILSELIPIAKARYAAGQRGERVLLRKAAGAGYTPDTPVPYRISDLADLINERMGKLENRSSWMKYHRLITRIETLGQDSRYAFMFDSLMVEDMMSKVLADLFRLPIGKEPITVMQLAGFPAEVVDSVVSVLCRLAFEFGVWCDGSVPILVACEEAHRYAPADRKLGFGPTRKALSRIAKEGRKYSVFLGVITQRPADLDATILSQCSTVFAMRMANERDQAIVKSAVPDAGSSLIGFLASLGIREAIAFGEGVALPTRLRFSDLAREFLPRSQHGGHERFEAADAVDEDFVDAIVDRWREASTTSARARPAASMPDMVDLDHGLGSLEAFATAPAKQQR
jgi:DNA helicase HerA-like ATPase